MNESSKIVTPSEWLSLLVQQRGEGNLSPVGAPEAPPTPPVPGASFGGEINGVRYWIVAVR